MDGKTFRDKSTYVSYLLENGYAYTGKLRPDVVESPIEKRIDPNPLSTEKATVADMFDEIEAQAKADFVKRGRKSKKENA